MEGLEQGKPSVGWDLGMGSSIQTSPGELLGVLELPGVGGGTGEMPREAPQAHPGANPMDQGCCVLHPRLESRQEGGSSSCAKAHPRGKAEGISPKGHQECSKALPEG